MHHSERKNEDSYYESPKMEVEHKTKATKASPNQEKHLFHCETCPKAFKNRYQLVIHTRSHTGEKPFQCPICERGFSMASNLQKHVDTHSTDKPYKCVSKSIFIRITFLMINLLMMLQKVCGDSFKTQRSLKFHTICHHETESKVKCPQCDKSFVNNSYLKVHMLYHTGELKSRQKHFKFSLFELVRA